MRITAGSMLSVARRGQRFQWLLVLGASTVVLLASNKLWRRFVVLHRRQPPNKLEGDDEVLDVDAAPDDYLYRISRAHGTRVVYVWVKCPGVIPQEDSTYGPSIIRHLSKLKEWLSGSWSTLGITQQQKQQQQQGSVIQVIPDAFTPHRVAPQYIQAVLPLFDIFSLRHVAKIKSRTLRGQLHGRPCYVKMARSKFELPALEQEIKAYHYLMSRASALAPVLIGYVYEESQDRVVGLVLEEVVGRHPDVADFEACDDALRQLHALGMVHGDPNRYNFILAEGGTKMIDFEASVVGSESCPEWMQRVQKERSILRESLSDDSGLGRPYG